MSNETEVTEKSEDELFDEALRNELRGEVQPDETEAEDVTDAQEPAEETTEEVPPAAPERTEVIPGYTADELAKALGGIGKLQKAIDTTNGTYGQKLAELAVTVDQLVKRSSEQPKLVMPKINLSKLKEAEYDELAELLQNSFDESFKELEAVPASKAEIDLTPYEEKLKTRMAEFEQKQRQREQEIELKLLKRQHPDFAEVAGYKVNELGMVVWNNFDFGNWAATALPPEEQQGLLTSDDAGFLSEVLTRYKDARKEVEQSEQQPIVKDKKVAILENAIKPKGAAVNSKGAKTDDEIFREAYLKELRSY